MATKVIMPKQGLQMTEGNIMQWLAAEGEEVTEGEPLFEMETDKLTIEIDAPASGTLLKIIHGEGAVVPITHIIGVIGESGEEISDIVAEAEAETAGEDGQVAGEDGQVVGEHGQVEEPRIGADEATAAAPSAAPDERERRPDGRVVSSPRARLRAEERGIDLESVPASGPEGMVIERDVLTAAQAQPAATPAAVKRAAAQGVPLSSLQGSGPRGKVYERDLPAARTGVAPAAGGAEIPAAPVVAAEDVPTGPPVPELALEREDRLMPLGGMRRTIAQRMRESLDTAAQAVHRLTVDMSETVRLRNKLKEAELKVSYNDIILKAVARALREHPRMNSALTDQGILEFGHINVGVAVALDDGLIVPVIRDADLLSLSQIHGESRRLGHAARNGSLTADEMQGGTFSVSNLGMYGLDGFTAIIDAPESGILAVGAIKDRVVPVNGEPAVRPMCELSLTYDHRVVDGAPAAAFLGSLAGILENPYTLL